jgi:pyruvate ferredoxin oxidoreductase gamma subunit
VLRVRFHGRGGHGIKTASRILGTGAFLAGLYAQDSPIYGAERRGAALAAYTRLGPDPIMERGVIVDPDLIVVADETLLADPAAGVLVGANLASALFVNTVHPPDALARQYGVSCPVVTLDLTSRAAEHLGRRSALSAPLGAAACALTGRVPRDTALRAVREELADLHLAPEAIEPNLVLAREVDEALRPVPLRERPALVGACELYRPVPLGAPAGVPVIYAPGNSPLRHTGAWRIFRPVIDRDRCTRCGICFVLCPDGAITPDAEGYPVIDYDNCKGCMICNEECPVKCIHEEREVQAW